MILKRKVAIVALLTLILAVAVFLVYEARQVKPTWDESYPIVNANISWEQTYYGGFWK